MVKRAHTHQELWCQEGWAVWNLQATNVANLVVMQGPFAIILTQQEVEANDFTCHVTKIVV